VCCRQLTPLTLRCTQEDTSWVAMKAFLGKRSVKEDILSYDAHRILTTPGARARVTPQVCCGLLAHQTLAHDDVCHCLVRIVAL
jgi:hypothetical protein